MEKTALITGASTGIGKVFAERLAEQGMNLVLAARSGDKLKALADELSRKHSIHIDVIPVDLSKEKAYLKITDVLEEKNLEIDTLINNAGFALSGEFSEMDHDEVHEQTMLNVTTVVDLTKAILPGMKKRGTGTIINLASTVAFQPVPYMAIYGATKAFVLSFTEALWEENRGNGIRILALCPGATGTNFFDRAGDVSFGKIRTPEQVVETAMEALEKGKSYVIDGKQNRLAAMLPRFTTRTYITKFVSGIMKKKAERN